MSGITLFNRLLPRTRAWQLGALFVCLAVAAALSLARAEAASGPTCGASASTVAPSCFEGGDGNLAVNTAGHTDWNGATAPAVALPDASGNNDTQFSNGSKQQEPDGWTLLTAGVSPDKSDVLRAVVATETVATGNVGEDDQVFLYGAFQTLGDSGNTAINLELNQKQTKWTNSQGELIPERTAGDALITYDGKGGAFTVGICKWVGNRAATGANDGWHQVNPVTGAVSANKLSGGENCTVLPATIAKGAASPTALTYNGAGGLPGFPTGTNGIPADTFGELSINLTKALTGTAGGGCFSFGQAWINTRSSDTVTSAMNDYVEPVHLPPTANCAISVQKQVSTSANGPFEDADTAGDALVTGANTDPLYYKINVTNTGTKTLDPLTAGQVADANCGALTGPDTTGDASPATFDVGDTWVFTCSQDKATGGWTPGGSYTNEAIVTPTSGGNPIPPASDVAIVHFRHQPTLSTSATSANVNSAIHDDATLSGGNGLTGTLTFTVFGPNNASCSGSPVATQQVTVNGDGTYSSPNYTPTTPGTYRWIASYGGDANNEPVSGACNDPGETSQAFNPRIAIAKSGPATAEAGSLVPFVLTVTNPGDVSFAAASVVVSDNRCTTPVTLTVKQRNGAADPSPGTLDPGDSWIYGCSVQTVAGETRIDNIATVNATDATARTQTATAVAGTDLTAPAPQQQVLAEQVKSGVADFVSKPKKCVSKKFNLDVKGTAIAKVTFKIDGKKIKALSKSDSAGRFRLAINPLLRSDKRHTVTAEVEYTKASNTPKKTLKVFFKRCACISRRSFTIRLRKQFKEDLRSATVFVNKKRVNTFRGQKRLKAGIKLVGLPKGRITVKINAVTVTGKRVTGTRRYLTCNKKLKGGIPKL